MKLFLLGATGGIGRRLIRLSLERGHRVTAFVRSPQKISESHPGLTVVPGDLYDAGQMARVLPGHDIALSAFGPASLRAGTARRDFGRTVAKALRSSGVSRVQLVSAAFLFPDIGVFGNLLKAIIFRRMAPDMAAMEGEIRQHDLDWTIIRPPRLTDSPARHAYRVADGVLPPRGFLISRADVAHFMISEDENPRHSRQIVGLSD